MYMCRKACKLFWCCRPDHIGNFWKILLWTVCIIIALAVGKIVLAMKMFSKFSGMMYDPFNNTTAMPVTIQDIQVQFCTTTTDAINMWKFGSRNSDKSGGWYWSLTVSLPLGQNHSFYSTLLHSKFYRRKSTIHWHNQKFVVLELGTPTG